MAITTLLRSSKSASPKNLCKPSLSMVVIWETTAALLRSRHLLCSITLLN